MSASLKWAVIIIDELQFFVSVFCSHLSDTVINCSLKLKLPNKGYYFNEIEVSSTPLFKSFVFDSSRNWHTMYECLGIAKKIARTVADHIVVL